MPMEKSPRGSWTVDDTAHPNVDLSALFSLEPVATGYRDRIEPAYGSELYLKRLGDWADPFPAPVVEEYDGVLVVRDDLLPAGSKQRFADYLVSTNPTDTIVYAQPRQGYAGIVLAYLCRRYGLRCRLLAPSCQAGPTPHQQKALDLGAEMTWHQIGGMSALRAKCLAEATHRGGTYIEMGLRHWSVTASIIRVARNLYSPAEMAGVEVWSVASTGVLQRGLQLAWPEAKFHAVQVARNLHGDAAAATVYLHYQDFASPTKVLPPFPSVATYDAKAWEVLQTFATKGNCLFWNVAG